MGLYLCVFDDDENEICGVEIGSYADFNWFRLTVSAAIEGNEYGSLFPVLMNHSDCDGVWPVEECILLDKELALIEQKTLEFEPVAFNSRWQDEVRKKFFLKVESLRDCFFDVDGEPLIDRLRELCRLAIESKRPIEFQ